MKDTPVHLALRELRRAYTDPLPLAVMIGIGAAAGLTGPFGTFENLPLAPRLLYWLLIALGTYGAGLFGSVLADALWLQGRGTLALRIALLGLAASVPVTMVVVLITLGFFPDLGVTGIALHELYIYNLAISLGLIALLGAIVLPRRRHQNAEPMPEAPPILDRLPRPIRGSLSHMSMADHYVEVFTDKGKAMVLMRLADAIAETRGVPGLQIHRSHWVATDAVATLKRLDGRPVIELKSGEILPVSRSYLAEVRAAFSEA